jgi:hypothetical protein
MAAHPAQDCEHTELELCDFTRETDTEMVITDVGLQVASASFMLVFAVLKQSGLQFG